ncbi:MAG TPA: DUF3108 domain-containing protein [Beijerinckiaceae bacterium]|nr:DUF3108 domain-containing protein [Beijerinckiaceae bacterium]
MPVRIKSAQVPGRALVAASFLALTGVPAVAGSIEAQYGISLAGLTLGTATLTGDISKTKYALTARASLTGLAGMVSGGRGAATVTGTIQPQKVVPAAYAVTAASSDMTRTIQLGMNPGGVHTVVVHPPLEPKADRVPVKPEHQRGVLDPLSAILMPTPVAAGFSGAACNRTIPVFDGAQRFDVQLSYAGMKDVSAEGYSGQVIVCKARYHPVSGHRSERPATKYMQANRDMEAWLAPTSVSGVFIPFRVSVKTMVGTTVIQAQRFVVGAAQATAKSGN